ncbi:MAG: hypothetical protein AD742_19760 [Methylibium sp. NZG]|nr:MAG: hypothetical protein AD742_19760 [Methylibium sp. NZG]
MSAVACVCARALAAVALALLAACSSAPPPPDWQMNAKASLERATAAYLAGNSRLEALEFNRARAEIARTGRTDLLARAELTRCAARVASLVFDDCPGFAALVQDAPPAERAYAAYLAGTATPQDAALLPEAQRSALAGGGSGQSLAAIADPVSRLVAAGVLLRSGRAQPPLFALAAETASSQGWSRPLLAWLNVQVQRAEAAGEATEADRLRRRIAVVTGGVKPEAAR